MRKGTFTQEKLRNILPIETHLDTRRILTFRKSGNKFLIISKNGNANYGWKHYISKRDIKNIVVDAYGEIYRYRLVYGHIMAEVTNDGCR